MSTLSQTLAVALLAATSSFASLPALAKDALKVATGPESLTSEQAPTFELRNQDGKTFKLADRKNQGWTVLFFYPKAGTPGCTTQACAFRDSVQMIKKLNSEVYGISADTVAEQKKFHDQHKLTFDLLADADMKVIKSFHVEAQGANHSTRTTVIIDPTLRVRRVLKDVDPALDAQNVAKILGELQK